MKKIFFILINIVLPVSMFAATSAGGSACVVGGPITFTDFKTLLEAFTCLIGIYVIPILFSLAFIYFLWNIANTIRTASNPTEVKNARKTMIISVVALFVMVSVWGLVKILSTTFGLGGSYIPQIRHLK